MCGPGPCSVDSPCLHGAGSLTFSSPPDLAQMPPMLVLGPGLAGDTLTSAHSLWGDRVAAVPCSTEGGGDWWPAPRSRTASGGQNHGQRQRRGMEQFAAGCLLESGSQQKQSAGLWVRPWQERARLESCLSCAAGFTALYFGPTPSESSPAVKGCRSDHGPHRPASRREPAKGGQGHLFTQWT